MFIHETIHEPLLKHPARSATANATVYVNGRFRVHQATGLQRYAEELIARMGGQFDIVEPGRRLTGLAGHAWEQLVLPLRTRGGLLWSPCNTGPVAVRRQVV